MKKLRRISLTLALLAGGMGAIHSPPAQADHPYRNWEPGATITIEDRTGNEELRRGLRASIDAWNGVGANFTLVYSEGPADNWCGFIVGKVTWCIRNGTSYAAITNMSGYPYANSSYITIRADSVGCCFGAMHENGHAIGLAHSCHYSVMYMGQCYTVDWSLQARAPTAHDAEVLVKLYGPRSGPAPTTTTTTTTPPTTTTTPTTTAPTTVPPTTSPPPTTVAPTTTTMPPTTTTMPPTTTTTNRHYITPGNTWPDSSCRTYYQYKGYYPADPACASFTP